MKTPYDISRNSTGREFLNRVLVPRFSEYFKDGDKILCTGKHPYWDYSVFFNGPHKQCEYVTVDIREEIEPDIVDNLGNSKQESGSYDGILCIGLFDSLIDTTKENAKKELTRLLKKGGRMLLATPINCISTFIRSWEEYYVDEIYSLFGEDNLVHDKGFYQEGKLQSIFIIMRKK